MRKSLSLYCMAALLLGACTTLEEPAQTLQEAVPGEESLTGIIVAPETRVGFDDNLGHFTWTAGDKIAVHVSDVLTSGNELLIAGSYKTSTVTVNNPSDASVGTFSVVLSGGQKRNQFAVYPSVSAVSTAAAADGFKVCLPAQREISGSMDDSPAPMIAINDPDASTLTFQHVGALLRLELKNVPPETKKIAVSMGKRITGEFAVSGVTATALSNPSITTEAGSDEVVFVLSEALTAYQSNFTLNVPIPTGTYPSLRITARKADDEPIHSYYDEVERSFDAGRGRHASAQLSNLTTPLCLEATEIASVVISNPLHKTIELSSDAITWTPMSDETKEIWLGIGDKLYFRGDNAAYANGSKYTNICCNGRCALYGNIMSLIQSVGFNDLTTLTSTHTFSMLFSDADIFAAAGKDLLLPATILTNSCYAGLFSNCSALNASPDLPSLKVLDSSYKGMFENCTSLTTAPNLPATELASNCYDGMFSGCTALSSVGQLPAETMKSSCYSKMFNGCSSLEIAPELPATTLAISCYSSMFSGCTSLWSAPKLDVTILKLVINDITQYSWNSCYSNMFKDCSSLTNAPALPATSLSDNCYYHMFEGCTSLETAPRLDAMSLAPSCYQSMFEGCSSLINPPALPATTMKDYCYNRMFCGCSSLEEAPNLESVDLAKSCYSQMFYKCSSLRSCQEELKAMDLKERCYSGMFRECTSLERGPALPAFDLVTGCYDQLFYLCHSLTYVKAMFLTEPNSNYNSSWMSGLAPNGTLIMNAAATWNPADYPPSLGIPTSWSVIRVDN